MAEIPELPNFFSSLHTALSKAQIAELYGVLGWRVRKSSWEDYQVECDWAELLIEASSPILMHGFVFDIANRADALVAPLRAAPVVFTAECYGPEPDKRLLFELRS